MGKETDMEKAENNHRAEVTVFRQKIKHLEYDHSNDLRKVEVD